MDDHHVRFEIIGNFSVFLGMKSGCVGGFIFDRDFGLDTGCSVCEEVEDPFFFF